MVQNRVRYLRGSSSGNLSAGADFSVGAPGQLVVGLRSIDFNLDGHRDFEVYLSRDPSGPAASTTRVRFTGNGTGSFTLQSSTPGVAPPSPLPSYPVLIDLDGQGASERVSVTRREDGQSNLPITAAASPGDVTTPDAFATPEGGTFSRTIRVTFTPIPRDACLAVFYTVDGSTPAEGAPGTHVLGNPEETPLYFHRTATLRWFARCDLESGPERTETYVIDQPLQVDSDGDGIPDAYEIMSDARARKDFDPLGYDADEDGDGVSDIEELRRGTPIDTLRVCEGGATPGAGCDSDEDCLFGFCRLTCQGGSASGQTCDSSIECPQGTCGDDPNAPQAGFYLLAGT
ncbi:MAG: hypothetical protein HC882_08645, partial [Acidobacteria bacterium]|nr:hypothetical protein [Acidobacteriota bacterium]